MKKLSLVLIIAAYVTGANAQVSNLAGTVRGQILDASTGEALIGANVYLTGTTDGTITDFDGNYTLNNIEPGLVSITASYVSYETRVFNEVEVPPGEVVILNANLSLSSQNIEEVVVSARKREQTEAAVLVMKKKMPSVLDGISSQQISRLGDSDAASALKRVTGVSVQGGKYIYVRGLSDRYSTTTLNGAQIPGLDPEKNTVQMDLFPSNIIENLMVFKTFSPDLPGNATGGLVNVVTKDFPERFTLQFSAGLGYNPQVHLRNDFLSYDGGGTDWLGLDDGSRDVPEEVDGYTENGQLPFPFYGQGSDDTLGIISRAFNKSMDNTYVSSSLDQSYSFSLGNRVELFGRDLGFNISANYSKEYQMYEDAKDQEYSLAYDADGNPSSTAESLFTRNQGSENVIWSGLANLSYKLNNNNSLGVTLMRNQSGSKSSDLVDGVELYSDQSDVIEQILGWMERSITTGQLKGKHVLSGAGNATIDWMASYTLATQDEPDLRFFFLDYDRDNNGEYYNYKVRRNKLPVRYYREMDESNLDLKLNYSQPFKMADGNGKIQLGGAYMDKNRTSLQDMFTVKFQGNVDFDGTAESYLRDENIIEYGGYPMVYYENSLLTDDKNSYEGRETIIAGFAMADLPVTQKLRAVAGVRGEHADIFIENLVDTVLYPNNVDDYDNGGFTKLDLLPSLNLVYALSGDMNLRMGYNRTVARPVFRELAPYASYDFKAGLRKIGNPDLQKTDIDNIDFRWEWFMNPGEILSFSAFYKHFRNPIELRDAEEAANPEIHFENIEDSRLYGVELEFRKHLDFVRALKDFSIGTNVTLVKSFVQEDSTRLASATYLVDGEPVCMIPETRAMFGQSPYVINAYLNYHNFERGWDVNLGFNVAGEKLVLVSKAATPDVYEQPFPVMDFNISKQFGNGINLKLSAENLLNPYFSQTYTFPEGSTTETGYFRQYKLGRKFSLSLTYLFN